MCMHVRMQACVSMRGYDYQYTCAIQHQRPTLDVRSPSTLFESGSLCGFPTVYSRLAHMPVLGVLLSLPPIPPLQWEH